MKYWLALVICSMLLFTFQTQWEGALFHLNMHFPEEYPARPPKCQFVPRLWHMNVYDSGTVCLSILNEQEDWKPSISCLQILTGIQKLLDTPNPLSPAQREPYETYKNDRAEYKRRVAAVVQQSIADREAALEKKTTKPAVASPPAKRKRSE